MDDSIANTKRQNDQMLSDERIAKIEHVIAQALNDNAISQKVHPYHAAYYYLSCSTRVVDSMR